MGCKQCKTFFTKHHNSTIIIEPQIFSTPKRTRNIQFTKFDYPSCPTLDNLPVELIYHILDRLDTNTILISLYNVCKRLNSILQNYDQYELNFKSISKPYFHQICALIRPEQIISLTLSDGKDTVGLVKLFLEKFRIDSFQRLRSLTLLNIDDNEQMIRIFLSITDQLQILTIENSQEIYDETVIDILMTMIGKRSLRKLSLDLESNRISNASILWPMECFLHEIKLVGVCNITLFRNILLSAPNLSKFQAYDLDFDDEWIIDDDEEEHESVQMLPIINASNLTSLSLIYARNEMEKLEWFLPQLTRLKSLKYLNIYDFHFESIDDSDYSLFDGERWEKLLDHCNRFELILTIHIDDDEDDSWNIHHCFGTFQTNFWKEKNWNITLEQYEKLLLIYSLPYAHNSHYLDRLIYFSIPQNPFLFSQAMANVTRLRINLFSVNNLETQVSRTNENFYIPSMFRLPVHLVSFMSLI